MKKAEIFGRKAIVILYVSGLLGMLIIIAAIIITRKYGSGKETYSNFIKISNDWSLDREGTEPADLNKLGGYMDEERGAVSIYYRLPYTESEQSLVYRSKDVYTRILVGDEVLYETNFPESAFYNRSPGNLWNTVAISPMYAEKVVEMQVSMVYDTSAVTVDSVMLGDKTDIILTIFRSKIFGILVSMLMIIIGVVLTAVDIMPVLSRARKRHGTIWLGIFSLLMGIWSLIETNAVQFIVSDMRILQLLDNMIMIVDSIPILIYLDCEYHIFRNRFMRFLGYANTIFILSCVFFQLSGITDMHAMLPGAMLTTVLFDITLLVWVVVKFREMVRKNQQVLSCEIQLIGLCVLWLSGLCETIHYFQTDHIDRAEFLRVGMLIFVICFSVSSQLETYRLLENGLKFDIISKLAYSDGLTGLGNRTAYLEQIEAFAGGETGIAQLGIVFLDVNNLKKVNDNQGHEKGDELITIASRIISDSFGKFGKSYRIGGDEFCVLMTGLSLQEKYEEGLIEFENLIEEANKAQWYTYEVQIANGFSICDTMNREKIDEAIMSADSAMYANKSLLKSGRKRIS